ncbi:MAG: peptide deformylase [Burkholderiales bacterium]
MTIRTVLKMGAPRLLERAQPVETFDTPELHALLQDMRETMVAYKGVGLAAPQIDVGLQALIFEVSSNPRYPDAEDIPYTVLLNPVLTPLSEEMAEAWEGCLSVPGMRGLVPRYVHLRYQGYDQFGNRIDRTVSGFHARVVQHETDHLLGRLYPMRIKALSNFGFADAFQDQG